MSRHPRATVSGDIGVNYHGDQLPIPSHVVAIPGCGDVLFHHAVAVNVSMIQDNNGPRRIALMIAQEGCTCGCQARGRGLFLTPDAAGAREIARRLIARAEAIEAEASEQAAELLRKASGK